jgi:hypothetical protein
MNHAISTAGDEVDCILLCRIDLIIAMRKLSANSPLKVSGEVCLVVKAAHLQNVGKSVWRLAVGHSGA